jgi:hypothetical protein
MPAALGRRIAATVVLLVVTIAAWTTGLDGPAMSQIDAGMTRALASFAGARALNAAISLAQGTEFSAGIGAHVTFSVGEILDPVNDMVESFSNLMLLASVAFGIQKMLLMIGQDVLVKWVLTGVVAGWSALYLLAGKRLRWLDVMLILLLMVRFAVPVVTLASDAIYQRFLALEYEQSTVALENSTDAMARTTTEFREQATTDKPVELAAASGPEPVPGTGAAPRSPQPPQPGVWDSVTGAIQDTVDAATGALRDNLSAITDVVQKLDPRIYIERLKEQASNATDHIIRLMVVFMLQTVLVPLFLLWALYTALRGVLAGALVA